MDGAQYVQYYLGLYYDVYCDLVRESPTCSVRRVTNYALFRHADNGTEQEVELIGHIMWRVPLWRLAHVVRDAIFDTDDSLGTSSLLRRFYYLLLDVMGFAMTAAILRYLELTPRLHFIWSDAYVAEAPDDSNRMIRHLTTYSGKVADEMAFWRVC